MKPISTSSSLNTLFLCAYLVLCGLCNPQQGEREMLRAKGSRYGMKGPSDISSLEGDGIEHLRFVTHRSDKSGRELHAPSGKIEKAALFSYPFSCCPHSFHFNRLFHLNYSPHRFPLHPFKRCISLVRARHAN